MLKIRLTVCHSAAFSSWAPKLHNYYQTQIRKAVEHDPSLKRPFNSVFAAATYNLGPQTVCLPHRDEANLSFGMCAITALGNFDPRKGGHLVLEDGKLAIEFPSGSTILIPSAIMTHSNVPIAADEERCSFTQYTASALFTWVDHGFQTTSSFESQLELEGKALEYSEEKRERWKIGLDIFPKSIKQNS
jgi:hypothetical protein